VSFKKKSSKNWQKKKTDIIIVLYNIFYLIILIKMPINNPEESTEQEERAQEEKVTDEMAQQIVDWPKVDEEMARDISETINSIYKELTKLSEEIKGHFPEKILDAIKERAKENKLTKEEINQLQDIVKIIADKEHITQKEVEELEKISWLSEEELVIIRWETPIEIPVQVEDINPQGVPLTDSQDSWQNQEANKMETNEDGINSPEVIFNNFFDQIQDIHYNLTIDGKIKDFYIRKSFKNEENGKSISIKTVDPWDHTQTLYTLSYSDGVFTAKSIKNGKTLTSPSLTPDLLNQHINKINQRYQQLKLAQEADLKLQKKYEEQERQRVSDEILETTWNTIIDDNIRQTV